MPGMNLLQLITGKQSGTSYIVILIHHNLHHLHGRNNYGLYFTIWDRLIQHVPKGKLI